MGLKPWDLERMTTAQVVGRLDWIKHHLKQAENERREFEREVGGDG